MLCESCGHPHNGLYGSGRFCSVQCARSFSTKNNRNDISIKVSKTLKSRFALLPKVGKPKRWRPSAHNTVVEGLTPSPTTSTKGTGQTKSEKFFIELIKDGTLSISENGDCFNHKTKRKIGALGTGMYPKLSMSRGRNFIYHIQIHRLVWIVYKGDIPHNMILNHKDLNKKNTALSNLELVTHKGNTKHAELNGITGFRFQIGNTYHRKRKTFGNRYKTKVTK